MMFSALNIFSVIMNWGLRDWEEIGEKPNYSMSAVMNRFFV
jgi:hypothetical protein